MSAITENKSAKERIAEALCVLTSKKSVADITIAALCETAAVSKSSFYRNFSDIYDVFEYLSDGFVNKVCNIMLSLVFEFDDSVLHGFPESIEAGLVKTLFGFDDCDTALVDYLFRERDSRVFRAVVSRFVERMEEYASENGLNADMVSYITRFFANGIYYSVLTRYFETGKIDISLFRILGYFDLSEFK